uniref:Zf-C3HC4 domain-containing protein n=1 Tax=Globodera pallida TaxID=36090 RepID=A0A183CB52_GLOPA
MVSPACLHRFCPRCLLGTNCCPVCGISTRFEIDCNFTLIVSKMKSQSKQFTKRRIVDVLNADGANLSGPDNGRYSRMSTTHEKERERTSNSNVCHDVNPSTSSSPFTGPYGSDALLGQEAKNALQTAGIVNYIPIPATASFKVIHSPIS